jgi:hypothetical protein
MDNENNQLPQRFQGDHLGNAPAIMPKVPQSVESSRAIAEVQAAVISAKNFPRDTNAAFGAVIEACKRKRVAENAMYAYKRGGAMVTGPSIRMAEILAQNYGNLSFGIVELERRQGESQMMAFCHDLQSNTRQTRVFAVPHARSSKAAGRVELTDDRDVYEMTANQGARRLRACILGIIPPDFIDGAIEQCEATLKDADKNVPMADRIRGMLQAFSEHGVSQEMIEKRLQHKVDAINEAELVSLRKIYGSIKDGIASREEFFSVKEQASQPSSVNERLADIKVPEEKTEVKEPEKSAPVVEAPKAETKVPKPKAKLEPKPDQISYKFPVGRYEGQEISTISLEDLKTYFFQLKGQAKLDGPNAHRDEMIMAIGDFIEKAAK